MIPIFSNGKGEYLVRIKDLEGQPKTNNFNHLLKIIKAMGTNPHTEQPTSLEDMEEEVEVIVPSKEDEGSTKGNDTTGDE